MRPLGSGRQAQGLPVPRHQWPDRPEATCHERQLCGWTARTAECSFESNQGAREPIVTRSTTKEGASRKNRALHSWRAVRYALLWLTGCASCETAPKHSRWPGPKQPAQRGVKSSGSIQPPPPNIQLPGVQRRTQVDLPISCSMPAQSIGTPNPPRIPGLPACRSPGHV
jgi:hypothetical protein